MMALNMNFLWVCCLLLLVLGAALMCALIYVVLNKSDDEGKGRE